MTQQELDTIIEKHQHWLKEDGTGEELIKKAYADSELSGKCYEAAVRYVESLEKI